MVCFSSSIVLRIPSGVHVGVAQGKKHRVARAVGNVVWIGDSLQRNTTHLLEDSMLHRGGEHVSNDALWQVEEAAHGVSDNIDSLCSSSPFLQEALLGRGEFRWYGMPFAQFNVS